MYVMIDNYDSFVHNLAVYFQELGQEIHLIRNDQVDILALKELHREGQLDGLLLSPGPKSPKDCGQCLNVLEKMAGLVPILGVCLGHQIIGHAWNAKIQKGSRPMHGKVTFLENSQTGLFHGLPRHFLVTRYHSLIVSEEHFPRQLQIGARSEDGVIMALSHKTLPIYGVQFHPEAVLTEYGHELLANFINLCEEWRITHENNIPKTAFL